MRKSILLGLVVMAVLCSGCKKYVQPEIGARKVDILTQGKYQFKDLNKNGSLDPYEDWRLPMDRRISDLVSQMTLEEKVGLMFHPNIAVTESGEVKYDLTPEEKEAIRRAEEERYAGPIGPGGQNAGAMAMGQVRRAATAKSYIEEKNFRCILNNGVAAPEKFANWSNTMQEIAEASRLGIPIVFSSDPRHSAKLGGHVSGTQYFSHITNGEGQIGLTAGGDPDMMRRFGEIMAEEYRAVGLHMFLGPQIDVITEPRWSRNMGCFSESAELTAEMTAALIEGAQGDNVGPGKILVHLKHWPGSGPHLDGGGRWLVYPGNNQEYHYLPWKKGIEKGALAAMGYYSGTFSDSLNVNYSYHMSTEVLYGELGFKGAICTDWGVVGNGPLKPSLQGKTTRKDNMEMIINAGVDQMGSETQPELVVELVKEGRVSEERINLAASRILQWHFILGLFENPYVDPAKAASILQSPENEAFGLEAQHVSNVLLVNDGTLPAKEGIKVYVDGIAPEVAAKYGTVVDKPADADLIIYRTTASPDRRAGGMGGGQAQQEINIDFPAEKLAVLKQLVATGKPVVADINPTGSSLVITPELKGLPKALVLSFDPTDGAVMDVIFGRFNPKSKLPFEIPSSMDAVRAQKEDMPFDSKDPSFPFGFGLSYAD
ncbi:MAG: glycoside hydrolase family 3 C-terminal domain-containing protein [Bacteroidales bacterium]|nr:glycoside hydrolase family 3 C-terminal domain-containing protein [Bacteroidales bacterium]MBO7487774.1 glycoside hydrolase family 3 C-terminal domain-containing protein [Bacteroidales bacterium]